MYTIPKVHLFYEMLQWYKDTVCSGLLSVALPVILDIQIILVLVLPSIEQMIYLVTC